MIGVVGGWVESRRREREPPQVAETTTAQEYFRGKLNSPNAHESAQERKLREGLKHYRQQLRALDFQVEVLEG